MSKVTLFPYPMQYLGSKARIADWILDALLDYFQDTDRFLDVMAGSGAVSHAAHERGLSLGINDLQPYSYAVLHAAFELPRNGLSLALEQINNGAVERLIVDGARASYKELLEREDRLIAVDPTTPEQLKTVNSFFESERGNPREATGKFDLFISYYRNTYLGVRQCLEIDALCEFASTLPENIQGHIKAALVSAVTQVASTTTHLAQFLKPGSLKQTTNILAKRRKSVVAHVSESLSKAKRYSIPECVRVTNESFEQAIIDLAKGASHPLIYADPPYFKEHYSRYYHLLDTLVLYDFPELTWNSRLGTVTVGLYRKDRNVSDFGLRSQVHAAFERLIQSSLAVNGYLALSYADTSLLAADEILAIASDVGCEVKMLNKNLQHSGQGNRNQSVTEHLFMIGKRG